MQIPRDESAPILDVTLYQNVEVTDNVATVQNSIHKQIALTPDAFNSFEPILGNAETCVAR